ncbi:MAG: peptidoglycan-binding protein [Acetobacteraceae bacterium]
MDRLRNLRYVFPLMRGEDVRTVQQALIAARASPPCGVADGIYGDSTRRSVIGFQTEAGLEPDGVVGPDTWKALIQKAGSAPAAPLRNAQRVLADLHIAQPAEPALGPPPQSATEPPLNRAQARRVKAWLDQNFGPQIEAAIQGTPIDKDLVCAIACKETAPMWLGWIDALSRDEVLARCVFDASGDAPSTSRRAFPRDTAEFRDRYPDLADPLIEEANRSRALRKLRPASWVYKGYGIFQYDLQHIGQDETFFRDRKWADFDACMDRFMREMRRKLADADGDLREAVRRYNGSGPKAEEYADHVMLMRHWLAGG